MTEYAFYRMHNNTYLGECLSIACRPKPEEVDTDSLQACYILLVIKTRQPLIDIRTLEGLRMASLFEEDVPILLRLSSECLFGVFGDSHCDCEAQRIASIREIQHTGQGVYIHLPQEAQGNGLFYKAQELQIQVSGFDPTGQQIGQKTVHEAADYLLGKGQVLDKRQYTALARIFKETALDRYSYDIITDSPDKVRFFTEALGIQVKEPHPAKRAITVDNAGEFLAKLYRKGYTVSNHELEEIYLALFAAERIPARVSGLLRSIEEDINHGREFQADIDLLRRIVGVVRARGLKAEQLNDLALLKDVSSYEEYQVEINLSKEDIIVLFEKGILRGIDSLRYEENHFYDMASFEGVPARSLKIRYAFRISDRQTPVECKFIYKVPTGEKLYRIKSLPLKYDDIAKLLGFILRDCEQHLLPVFTHNVIGPDSDITVLLKRYTRTLRTLSLMGPEGKVRTLVEAIRALASGEEIPDPSNSLFINRKLSFDFEYDLLAKEELDLYRLYSVG
jgi:GTP cyclohydrolase II